MLIGIIINVLVTKLKKIISIILGITHNKPDINQTLLTTIGIIIVLEIIKPIIRIENKQIACENIGIRIIKTVMTETSTMIIKIIIILIRNGIGIMKL